MKGAREFHKIITAAAYRGLGELVTDKYRGDYRHGNILFRTGEHARGVTFQILLVDGDEKLEVYGVTGGLPGWTECYGWTRKGTWVTIILQYLRKLEREIAEHDAKEQEKKRNKEREANKVIGEKVDKFNEMFRCS